METSFRGRSNSRGSRGGRGRGSSLGRGRGQRFGGRGRGGESRGRDGGGRGRGRGNSRGGRGVDGRGRGNFRGGFRSEGGGRGRGRGGGNFRGGFRGGRAASHSPFRGDHEKKDHDDTEQNSSEHEVPNTSMNGEMRGNFRHSRGEGGGRGRGRGRGQRPEGSNFVPKVPHSKKSQKGEGSENQGSSIGKIRPQDVRRKYKLEPEETKKAILISNLPKKIESLHEEFKDFISSHIGPVKLITYKKITTSKVAFVNAICVFEEPSDSKLALKTLHGQEFHDHHLLVQDFKNSIFDKHHTSQNCVCVTNMSEKTSEEHLWKHFQGCGTQGMIHINRNVSSGAPLEAIINFKEADGVSEALKLNETKLLDSEIKVVHLDRSLSILVTNLNRQTTYQEFKEFFSNCDLVYFTFCRKVKKEQKAAIVYLADKPSHEKALSLNGEELKGSKISIASGTDKGAGSAYDVFLLNVPSGVSPKETIKVLREFGDVIGVKIPLKKCISRVSFKEADQAEAAVLRSTVVLGGKEVRIFPNIGKAIKTKKKEAKLKGEESRKKVAENGKTLKHKKSSVKETAKKSKQEDLNPTISGDEDSDFQSSESEQDEQQFIIHQSKAKKRVNSLSEENIEAVSAKKLKKSSQNLINRKHIKQEPKEEIKDESSDDDSFGHEDSVTKQDLPSLNNSTSKLKIKEEPSSCEEENEAKSSLKLTKSPKKKTNKVLFKPEIKREEESSGDENNSSITNPPHNEALSKPGKRSKAQSKSLPSSSNQKRKKKDSNHSKVKKLKKV